MEAAVAPVVQYGSAMKRWVIGSLAAIVLSVSLQVNALDREGVFDALVNAAITRNYAAARSWRIHKKY